jgi:putative flippase GtrA
MNAYDFDRCIYSRDCTRDFYSYCVKKQPNLLRFFFAQFWGLALYALGLISKTEFKRRFFSFLRGVKDAESEARTFWESHRAYLRGWYLRQRRDDDLIVSASPEFLLRPVCEALGITRLVASRVDPKTGAFTGGNCYGAEKVARVRERFGDAEIETFYSDSLSDQPMADIAKAGFLVDGEALIPWKEYRPGAWQKVKHQFLNFEFLRFLIIGAINTLNGVLFSYLYSRVLPPQPAFICGYISSLVISYLLNSFFTFHERLSFGKMLKFFVSYIPNFLIQNAVVFIVVTLLKLPALLAYILAAVIGIPVTFLLLKLFAFRSWAKARK